MIPRQANGGRDDPHTHCMPPNFPRAWTLPQYIKIVQTPQLMVVLHEFDASYREIFMTSRPLEKNPNPTWNGHPPRTGKVTCSSSRPMASATTCGSTFAAVR